jgi:WD repeat-containing protein 19
MFTHSKEGMKGMYLPTHSVIETWRETDTEETHLRYYMQNIALKRFKDCFRVIPLVRKYAAQLYELLGRQCLKHLELELAERAYQLCRNPGMVLAIQSVKSEYEKFILIGHVSILLHQHDLGEEFFLKSTRPELALEMRCDLNDWPSALKLAEKLAPCRVPFIAYKVGLQFEGEGKYAEARKYFEAAQLEDTNNVPKIRDHNKQCYAGIARTSARLGDVSRALTIAKKLDDKPLTIEVAAVCESMKQHLEAAQLFESVGMIERAAGIYIQIKYLKQAIPLIDKINSPKLLRELGKAKEAEKQFKDAEKAYERAHDWENVIRLNIQHLDGIEKAKHLLRTKCPTASCALMLAEHCEKMGNRKEAIEFMLMAGKREEAFIIAQSHDEMDEYRNAIIKYDDKNIDEHSRMAQYYEGKNQWGKAAYHYDKCENPTKALKLYIQAGDTFIPDAIDMVVRTRNEALINRLVDYLTGEVDGIPKDAIYTLQLYEKLNEVMKAVKIAIAISAQEQEAGNYKSSHQTLFEIFKNLKNKRLAIPYELSQKLMIVHSYILAKRMMKLGDHSLAARLLCRVSTFASMFPKHAVPILTSAVLESSRTGAKAAAYQWSLVLMEPENRAQIADKYKKKMEDIARRPVKTADAPEPTTPCPYCKSPVKELDTQCETCKNFIPFCIASGKHMVLQGWTCCPLCLLPAIGDEFRRILAADLSCPMCSGKVDPAKIVNVLFYF